MIPTLFYFLFPLFISPLSLYQQQEQQQLQLQQPSSFPNPCNDRCGKLQIPFPFHINTSCGSLSNAFHLSCFNSTYPFLTISSRTYRVLEFFPDGLLLDFQGPSSFSSPSSCKTYNDLKSFDLLAGSSYFGISSENVIGLYDCEDSSLCKADCETNDLPGCDGHGSGGGGDSPACCYPLSDHSVWQVGNGFEVFGKFGCRGFSSWVVPKGSNSGKRGVKLEWAVPRNLWNSSGGGGSSKGICDGNADVVNASVVETGIRCLCRDGFVGDGFVHGVGCLQSCIKDGREVYGSDCRNKQHSQRKLMIIVGILAPFSVLVSLAVLLFALRRPDKSNTLDSHTQFHVTNSFQEPSRTRFFTYHELEEATSGFGETQKLSEGRNGKIYTGFLDEGSHVAVHKVHCDQNGGDLIINILSHIDILSFVSHQNIARLLGCCIVSGYTPLVVYEYPENGTLEEHLHFHKEKTNLDWYRRLNIAVEIASLLAYLQYEISPPIFHRNLKSSYVFLTNEFSVKLSGFGMISHSPLHKNDIYDFGVVLLEIISGSNSLDLPMIALQKVRSEKIEEIVDPLLYYHEQLPFRREQIEVVADLATRCLLFGADEKLGMVDVARELIHITKESTDHGGNKRRPALEETFSNSSLLQMISMSPDSIHIK